MALPTVELLDTVTSHAMRSGLFELVNGHEPVNPPGHGLSAAIWVDSLTPVRSSGLASSSARLLFQVRLYSSAEAEPLDAIDPHLTSAVDALVAAYIGDFELGGAARTVDVHGADGPGLSARAGYLEIGGAVFRVYTIDLPIIVNDPWEQSP